MATVAVDANLEEQRLRQGIKFFNLIQGDLPIRNFYEQVKHSGQLLGFSRDTADHQFCISLNKENTIEAQRFRDNHDVEKLVDYLERLEQAKAEIDASKEMKTPQEPVTLQTSTDIEQLLKQQAEFFQKQIQELQKSIQQRNLHMLIIGHVLGFKH